jgi:thiamine-phosphate pyrophosphorylase
MKKTDLYLILPAVSDPPAFQPLLKEAMALLKPASVLVRGGNGFDERVVQVLGPMVTGTNAALLVEPPEDWREVARIGADGVHLSDPRQMDAALEALKPQRIVGCGGLKSRDAAMTAGDSGADYLMFGEPRPDGSLPSLEQVLDRCEWWAKVFTVPCVGYAPDVDAVPKLAETGVEFVALGPWLFEGNAGALRQRCQALL